MAIAIRAKYQLDMNMIATHMKTPNSESDLKKKILMSKIIYIRYEVET